MVGNPLSDEHDGSEVHIVHWLIVAFGATNKMAYAKTR